jgi:hypothetical protein
MASTLSDRIGSMRFEPSTDGGRKLKRIVVAAAALVAVLFLLPSTFTYVNPGYVGIVIHRAGGGVDPRPLGPGVHARVPFATGIEEYPVFLKTLVLRAAGTRARRRTTRSTSTAWKGSPSRWTSRSRSSSIRLARRSCTRRSAPTSISSRTGS